MTQPSIERRYGDAVPVGTTRREFLGRSAVLGATALAVCCRSSAWSQQATAAVETVPLSKRMVCVHGPNANAVAADCRDGVILVDGGDASWSPTLLSQIMATFAGKPIRALFDTHWHPEQTGSNVELGSRGVEIFAHENTKLWLSNEVHQRWSGKTFHRLPEAGIPSTTFYDSDSLQFSDRRVEYHYFLNAHTDGDIGIFFPQENVLVTGGAISNCGWPVIDWWTGGWIGGLLDGIESMLSIADSATRIVPSIGPVMSLDDLRAQHEMYSRIFDRIASMLTQSYSVDEVLAAGPTAEFDAQWGDPRLFVTLAFHSLWGHLRDAYDTRLKNIP